MSQQIIDLDEFAPASRLVRFTDRAGKVRTFDVAFMSFKSSMFMLAHLDEFRAMATVKESDANDKTFRLMLSVISEIAVQSDKELTEDFFFENLSIVQGTKLMEVAMEPILRFLAANPPAADPEKGDRSA